MLLQGKTEYHQDPKEKYMFPVYKPDLRYDNEVFYWLSTHLHMFKSQLYNSNVDKCCLPVVLIYLAQVTNQVTCVYSSVTKIDRTRCMLCIDNTICRLFYYTVSVSVQRILNFLGCFFY